MKGYRKVRLISASVLVALTFLAEHRSFAESSMPPGCPDSGVKIYLHRDGTVTVNGSPVAVDNLGDALTKIEPKPTVVCYSRDDPDKEPPPQAQKVIEAIIALRLPVGFFTDSTFKVPVRAK